MSALRLSPFTPSSFLSPSASPSVRRNVNLLAVDRRSCCQLTTVISSARAVRPSFVEPYVKPTARFDDRRQASVFGRQEDSGAIPPTTVFLSLLALQSLFLSPSVRRNVKFLFRCHRRRAPLCAASGGSRFFGVGIDTPVMIPSE